MASTGKKIAHTAAIGDLVKNFVKRIYRSALQPTALSSAPVEVLVWSSEIPADKRAEIRHGQNMSNWQRTGSGSLGDDAGLKNYDSNRGTNSYSAFVSSTPATKRRFLKTKPGKGRDVRPQVSTTHLRSHCAS